MIEGLIGVQLLNLSAAVALRIIWTGSDGYIESPRVLDCLLVLGGALAGIIGIVSFLRVLGPLAPILWPLSYLAFVMGIWPVEERARSLLGLVSLIAGAVLWFESMAGFSRLPDCSRPMYSFCLGCTC